MMSALGGDIFACFIGGTFAQAADTRYVNSAAAAAAAATAPAVFPV